MEEDTFIYSSVFSIGFIGNAFRLIRHENRAFDFYNCVFMVCFDHLLSSLVLTAMNATAHKLPLRSSMQNGEAVIFSQKLQDNHGQFTLGAMTIARNRTDSSAWSRAATWNE